MLKIINTCLEYLCNEMSHENTLVARSCYLSYCNNVVNKYYIDKSRVLKALVLILADWMAVDTYYCNKVRSFDRAFCIHGE